MSASAPAEVLDRLSDERLALEVARRVRARCGRAVIDFGVSVCKGIATLRGQVRGYYQKQVLLNTVLAMPGILDVIDEVDVLPLAPLVRLRGSAEAEEQSTA